MDIGELVVLSVKHNASDLHLCADHPIMLHIDGELQPLAGSEKLTPEQMLTWYDDALLASPQRRELQQQSNLFITASVRWFNSVKLAVIATVSMGYCVLRYEKIRM